MVGEKVSGGQGGLICWSLGEVRRPVFDAQY